MYKATPFQVRGLKEIKADIDAMAAICNALKEMSHHLGYGGGITQKAAVTLMQQVPELNHHQGFAMIYHWLLSDASTAFIQDANSLVMKTNDLVEALRYLRATFPSIYRVTSYARSKTVKRKSLGELTAIQQAGLDRLHVGLESGDDTVLRNIRKGASAEIHIQGGRKAIEAGFQLSEYWMPGIGGKALWQAHAENTARVLNAINPHYIRSRPFYPWPGTPLAEDMDNRAFEMLSPKDQLKELKLTMEELDVTARVCFDHAGNYWKDHKGRLLFSHSYEGYSFPKEKQTVLNLIEKGLKTRADGRTI
jgi:radical SAM superfamily enzyme YgiQ (UPF0313 family)